MTMHLGKEDDSLMLEMMTLGVLAMVWGLPNLSRRKTWTAVVLLTFGFATLVGTVSSLFGQVALTGAGG